MEKIWSDRHNKRYALLALMVVGIFIFLYIFRWSLFQPKFSLSYISITIILFYFSIFIIHILRVRLTSIFEEGLRIGNAPDNSYEKFKLNKSAFIYWEDITELKIYGKDVRTGLAPSTINLLRIKTKEKKKYESFLAQPKDFVDALKQLKKGNLLSKNSKYLDLLKK